MQAGDLTPLLDVPLELEVQMGTARVPLRDLLQLRAGAVVTLDRGATDPVDVYAGGRLIARGDVVSVDGELGVRITQILDGKAPT
jgi:flagellar motor switch protein FliN/FliY